MATNLYNFYTEQGQSLPSVQERAKIFESSGLGSAGTYIGSSSQNTSLLNALSAGKTAQVAQTTPQQIPQQTPQTQPSNVGVAQTTGQPGSVEDLINMGYGGYRGWGEVEAMADYKATGGQGKITAGANATPQPALDLTNVYDNLYNQAGISDLQTQLNAKTEAYNQAVSKINDNPYLSEANRVGRVQKLTNDFNNSIKTVQDQISQRTADVETKLNLATKQYDINSQAQQTAFSQLNSLLSSGALDSANASTIASLATSTGLSTDVINSAINANKKKNVATQLIQTEDDNGNVMVSVVDSNTGEIVKQTSLGQVGTKTKVAGGATATKESETMQNKQTMIEDIKNGASLRQLVSYYGAIGGLDPADIYNLYNQYSSWGRATESLDDVKQGIFYD